MLKIGLVGASPIAATGYGKEAGEIGYRLIDKGVPLIFIGTFGDVIIWGGVTEQITPKGNKATILALTRPESAADVINEYITEYKIDIIIGFMDCFGIEFLNIVRAPVIGYVPIDGPFTAQMKNYMKNYYRIIAYSKFGYSQLQKWYPPTMIGRINHGVDTDMFRPLSKSEYDEAREWLLKEYGIPKDAWLAVDISANIGPRKELPQMMRTFSKFKHENAHLFIHTNAYSPGKGFDLIAHRRNLNMEKRIHFPKQDPIIFPVSNETLRKLLGAAQVFVHNSVAEGCGLPQREAAGCGVPPIVPKNSAQMDNVAGAGWLVDNIDVEDHIEFPVYVPTLQQYPVPSQKSLLEKLEEAYNSPDLVKTYGHRSRLRVLHNNSWKVILPKWLRLFNSIEEELDLFKGMHVGLT